MDSSRRCINSSFNFLPEALRSFLIVVTDDIPSDQLPAFLRLNNVQLELSRRLSLRCPTFVIDSDPGRVARGLVSDPFRKIGAGACGAVFAQDGKPFVVKVAKTNVGQLWNDYSMHTSIADQFRNWSFTEVKIPGCYYFAPPRDPYFDKNPTIVEAAERVCNMPTGAILTERIFPLPLATRNLLIENYCPAHIKQAARNDAANEDCLVRIYLGSMLGRQNYLFSLRNFKMHLNQMIGLRLDVKTMAARMAIALAVMHWAAKTDAQGVEFVLGSCSKKMADCVGGREFGGPRWSTYTTRRWSTHTERSSHVRDDSWTRINDIWLLDFDQVQPITMDQRGVAKAVEAVKLNDPYFPRPLQKSRMEKIVWNEFVAQYLAAAHKILRVETNDQTILSLPGIFINGLINLERRKQQNGY